MILTKDVEVGISAFNIKHYSKIFENLHVSDILDSGEIITKIIKIFYNVANYKSNTKV